jgi:hypothetical protein
MFLRVLLNQIIQPKELIDMASHSRIKKASVNNFNPSDKTPKLDDLHQDESKFEVEVDSKKFRLEFILPTQFLLPIFSLAKKWALPILTGSYFILHGLSPNLPHRPILPPNIAVQAPPKSDTHDSNH